ncbi:MAG: phytoene desaturase [Planctomycetaceae bacterium]|nr:phytoene desaturase [Planctomycetaceae bacterium]MBT7729701.1 phytoene desaturase [Planctomycetaceae bacterium]
MTRSVRPRELSDAEVKNQVIVVGGGLGGLATACTLAARGYAVVLCDKNSWTGGKAAVYEEEGFRFDMGPTILTIPAVLKRIFDEAGQPLETALDLVPLDPQWRSFFDDGTTLDLHADVQKMKAELDQFSPGSGAGEGYSRFMDLAKKLHKISDDFFFWKSIGGLKDMFDPKRSVTVSMLREVMRMRPGHSVAGTVRSYVPDSRAAQMLDHYTQYVGSCPESSPAVLCGIAHMQSNDGVWYPRGGTAAVPKALTKLALSLGVEIRTNTAIRQILVEDGRASGVLTADGETIRGGAVVTNSDSVRTHKELLDGRPRQKFLGRRNYEPACSGVVLYLGLNRRYDQLLHHNFVFSADPHKEFEAIYRQGEPAPDPTCYVCAPAATEPGVAPPGGESLYVLVHTPYLRPHHKWSEMLPAYRDRIIEKLKQTAGLEDIEEHIVVEHALTPQDIQDRYHVLDGAIYGLASHGRFLGAFKPANRSPDVEGLYLAGGSAHPGPGMPMVLMSGWIAGDCVDQDRIVEPIGSINQAACVAS